MTLVDAITWMSRLGALATGVAALELMIVHRAWRTGGVYGWDALQREFTGGRALAGVLFGTAGTGCVLALQLAAALALPWTAHPLWPWLAFATTLVIAARFRGSYNGGSDAMLLVVLLGLALARTGAGDDRLVLAGLGYTAAQLVLSYLLAGISKLGDSTWRRGTALAIIVDLPRYGTPTWVRSLFAHRVPAAVATYAVLAWECGIPIAFADPLACRVFLAIAAAFHLGNAIAFGLDRFLWSWLAAFPALLFWVDRLRG